MQPSHPLPSQPALSRDLARLLACCMLASLVLLGGCRSYAFWTTQTLLDATADSAAMRKEQKQKQSDQEISKALSK